jgi:hypothetical protein
MKTCSFRQAKRSFGRLADDALKGHPTLIVRGKRLLILQIYTPSEAESFDALIDEGIAGEHAGLTVAFWKEVRARGRKLARKLVAQSAPPDQFSVN